LLRLPESISNTYYALRHAHSVANLQNRIVSYPRHGRSGFGLSSHGTAQCAARADSWRGELFGRQVVVIASDFLRAVETGLFLVRALNLRRLGTAAVLRERNFGQLEFQTDKNYKLVWDRDRRNPAHRFMGVESVLMVGRRTLGFIRQCEKKYKGCAIVLVSHGDALQILETHFRFLSPQMHRSLPPLRNAELRILGGP